ncbi:hypothetical protein LH23_17790 [Cedecea neteri]|uniref:Uncharacterized protein n=1 Tax=Cedecea neteri TaxID=158822 RepID=A0AAN0VUW3_9ENTR|nr:hypothetical protein [Cedecea neteri]AIR62441.1 hypothetical protein LH23_17790 [Cedecea neteri]
MNMRKKLFFACFTAAGIFSASTALAAPTWINDDVFSLDVKPTVVKTSTLSMSTSNPLTSEGNVKPGDRLFTINVSADATTKVALTGANETIIAETGAVRNTRSGPISLLGYLPSGYTQHITNEQEFFPVGSSSDPYNRVLLLEGEDIYNLDITVASDAEEKYTLPGTYTFEFVAQAYTE